ncbi:MAG: hypothetical protein U1E89_04135 [Burkholderiaceae bacterium]
MWTVERQRRHLRLTTRIALVTWLFALAVGVANACLLQVGDSGAIGASNAVPPTMTMHDAHGVEDGHTDHDGRANCLKFCADESSTVAKDSAKLFDLPQPAVAECVLPSRHDDVAVAVRVAHRLAEPPGRPGPSLVVLLLRRTT